MASETLIGPYILVNSVDLSDRIEELTIKRQGQLQTFVTSNVGGTVVYNQRLLGPVDFMIDVKFTEDFAAGKVHRTLTPLFGTTFTVVAALHGATPSAGNEVWTATCTFGNLDAGGAVGSHLEKTISFVLASGVPVGATS